MMQGGNGWERRVAPRYGCTGQAEILVPGRGLRYAGRIANLSAGGCFIETSCRLERGTSVELSIETHGMPLRVAANLVVCQKPGVGCRFLNVSARKLEQIEELIRELEEEQRCRAGSRETETEGTRSEFPRASVAGEGGIQ